MTPQEFNIIHTLLLSSPRIIGGVGIKGGLDIVIIINNREVGIIRGLDGIDKIV